MAYLMIVDDDEDFAFSTATVLRAAGHEVKIELKIPGAIRSMQQRPPELVILDVMFPEDASAGFAAARQIRQQNEELKSVPILLLTGVNARFPLGFGTRDIDSDWLPVDDFLEKPVEHDVLLKRVTEMLAEAGGAASPSDDA